MGQGADAFSEDRELWAYWPSSDDRGPVRSEPPPPADEPPPRPPRYRYRRLLTYAAGIIALFVLASAVGFWYVSTAPARAFGAVSADFDAEHAALAEQLQLDIEHMAAAGDMAANDPVLVAAMANAEAMQEVYGAYSERLGEIDFRGDARGPAQRLRASVDAARLLMGAATTAFDKDGMLQVLQAWPGIDASIREARGDLRAAL